MSLLSFLERKAVENQIIRVKGEVSPHFEVSSIMKHFDQKRALQFFIRNNPSLRG
jgi:UbiD family decarboxylase